MGPGSITFSNRSWPISEELTLVAHQGADFQPRLSGIKVVNCYLSKVLLSASTTLRDRYRLVFVPGFARRIWGEKLEGVIHGRAGGAPSQSAAEDKLTASVFGR
jgi:hypothetical protein